MKNPNRRWLLSSLVLLLPLLPGCSEMDGQINALKDRIDATRESNNAATVEVQKLNQELALLNRQISAESTKRREFEERAKKSAGTERIFVKYQAELETSLKEFSDAVTDYRKKYLAP